VKSDEPNSRAKDARRRAARTSDLQGENAAGPGADFLAEHADVTRRYFLRQGLAGGLGAIAFTGASAAAQEKPPATNPKPEKAGAFAEPYFTPAQHFRDVSRGKPIPHSLSQERRREVGLTPDTWGLEVISDIASPAKLKKPLSREAGTLLRFDDLLKLGETKGVRFPKVMTCLNVGCPLGMGLWEGVPLRDVIWLTQPQADLRRVFFYGFHNDDPKQIFRSSLPIGRVFEDPFGLPPVILCYKLNGEWLSPERGGPVRIVAPEHYGFKSIKWLSHVVLTNAPFANDTYAEQNNDVDSPLKTFAASLSVPREVKPGQSIPVSGYAQVGVTGLSKVQVSIEPEAVQRDDDPHHALAPWTDAEILPTPEHWHALKDGLIPEPTFGFAMGKPVEWPMRLTNAHWAANLPPLPAGEYTFRCRTIDQQGNAQPMPRPFRKSGHAAIESVKVTVKDA
jgi:hypothetical protein